MGLPPLRAVVVGDDQMARQAVEILLGGAGFAVQELPSAKQAVAATRKARPHVIILDLALTGIAGLEAVPVLRRLAPDAVIVVFSADAAMGVDAEARGASAVIDKSRWGTVDETVMGMAEALQAVAI